MKLRFIGEDGSMGLKNGEAYDARIYIRGKFLWVEWKVGRLRYLPRIGTWHTPLKTQEGNMAQKRIRMVQRDILNDRLRLLYDDGTQGVLEYGEAVSRSKAPAIIKPNDFVGLTLKQAKLKLGIKN